ncbi:MAG: hypothetical protein DRJ03_13110 [Chloroflexi bacterium]|nr:MAG: hypothetical protein DRJ03_13110 [Chloroflexota bacterium]
MNQKQLRVIYGPRGNTQAVTVELNGILADEPLTPKMARRAARIANGCGYNATVVDAAAGYGYRLYKESARKIYLDD